MTNVLFGFGMAVVYMLVFWWLGALIPDRFQVRGVPVLCLSGFLIYFSLFQIIALPMKILELPLSYLTVTWGLVLLFLVLYILVRRRKILIGSISGLWEDKGRFKLILFLGFFSLCLALFLGYNINIISEYDAAYYIGMPVSSTYSNTIGMMSPYTGRMLSAPDQFYILNTDMMNSAVIYQALNLHPLIERKWSFTIAMVLLFEMGLYKCGRSFFEKEYAKTAVFCVFANFILLFSYSIAGVSHYFAYRTYEGKSVTSYFYTMLIFCFCLALYKQRTAKWPWAGLFLCAVSGVAFCNTALFVIPAMMGCTLFPYVAAECVRRKRWGILGNFLIVLLPCIVWMVLHEIL